MKKILFSLLLMFVMPIAAYSYDEQYIEEQFDLGEGTVLRAYNKFRDGGTEYFRFSDNWGNDFLLYIDGRIDSETIGSFFIDDYPGYDGKRIEKGSRPEEKLLYLLRDTYLYKMIELEDDTFTVAAVKAALSALLVEKGMISDANEKGIATIAVKEDRPANDKEAFQLAFNNCEIGKSFITGAKGFALYKYTIIAPDDEGCILQSEFLENINPQYVGKTMQCIYDNSLDIYQAVKNTDQCEGELYDFMFDN